MTTPINDGSNLAAQARDFLERQAKTLMDEEGYGYEQAVREAHQRHPEIVAIMTDPVAQHSPAALRRLVAARKAAWEAIPRAQQSMLAMIHNEMEATGADYGTAASTVAKRNPETAHQYRRGR